jgi:excisionase family DNA binding protein
MSMVEDELLATSVAARLANVSANTIRIWADLGRLPAIRTSCGQRLFRRADVIAIVAQREAIASSARSIVPGGKNTRDPVD